MRFSTYKTLSDAGLDIAIITDHPEIPIENLSLCCAMAVQHGMDKAAALHGITSTAAKNCRINRRVGTLEAGKDADIVLFDRLPCEFGAKALLTIIQGRIVFRQ